MAQCHKLSASVDLSDPTSAEKPENRARCIFDALDTDSSGNIAMRELTAVFARYGMPLSFPSQLMELMDQCDDDAKAVLSFPEFFEHLKPFWEWAFADLRESLRDQQSAAEKSETYERVCKTTEEEFHKRRQARAKTLPVLLGAKSDESKKCS